MKLIDKSALVAEIERLIAELVEEGEDTMFEQGRISAFEDVKVFINHTLEAKENDLVEELDYNDYIAFFKEHPEYNNGDWGFDECWVFAKYFFELSLKAKENLKAKEVEEEPVCNDLEEAADKYLVEKGYLLTTKNGEHLAEVEAKGLFKAGAKWQKEQIMKDAVEAVIHPYDGEIWVNKDLLSTYDDCQRVKVIIIKDE